MKIALQIKVSLENISNFQPNGDDFRWYIKVKCLSCGEVTKSFLYISLDESQPIKGSRGSANLVMKCKICSRQNSLDIIKDAYKGYTPDDGEGYKTVVAFDCRGAEPVEFSPRNGFMAAATGSGSCYDDVDMTEGDWVDYDEEGNQCVRVYDLEYKFIKVK